MSDQDRADTYGKAALRLRDAKRDFDYVTVELKAIGSDLEATGKDIRNLQRLTFIDHDTMEKQFARVRELVEKHESLVSEVGCAQAAMDLLDSSS